MSRRLEIVTLELKKQAAEEARCAWTRQINVTGFERTNHPGPGGLLIPIDGNCQELSARIQQQKAQAAPADEPVADEKPSAAPYRHPHRSKWSKTGMFFVRLGESSLAYTKGHVYELLRHMDGKRVAIINDQGGRIAMTNEEWTYKLEQTWRVRLCDKDGWVEHKPVEGATCPVPDGIRFVARLRDGVMIEGSAVTTWAKMPDNFDEINEIVAWRVWK